MSVEYTTFVVICITAPNNWAYHITLSINNGLTHCICYKLWYTEGIHDGAVQDLKHGVHFFLVTDIS